MALKVGELYASLGLDDKSFEKSMKQGEGKFSKFGKNLTAIAGTAAVGITSALAGASVAMGGLVGYATTVTAEINKFAQTTGFSTKAFQEWDFVAKSFGHSMEQAAGDIAMFSERAMDAANGTGEGAELFKELGIAVTDNNGELKSQEKLFNETISTLQGMENITKRNALATAILGTTGEELAPVLNMTNSELEKMKGNANVISEDQIKQAEKFRLGWEQVKNTFSTVATQIGVEMMPMFQELLGWILSNMPSIKEFIQTAFGVVQTVIQGVISAIQMVIMWFQTWYSTNQATVTGIWTTIQSTFTQVREFIMTVWQGILVFWQENGQAILTNAKLTFNTIWQTILVAFQAIQQIIQQVLNLVVPFIQEKLSVIQQFWQENGAQIMQAVRNAFTVIQTIIQTVMPVVLAIIRAVWNSIKGVIDGVLKVIMGIIKVFAGIFTGDMSKLWEGIKNIFSGALQAIWNVFNLMIMGRIVGIIRSFARLGVSLFRNLVASIVNLFRSLGKNARSIFSNMQSKLGQIFSTVYKVMTQPIRNVYNFIKNIFGNILGFVTGQGRSFLSAGKGLIDQMVKGIKGAAGNAVNAVKNVASKVRNLLPFSPAKEGPLSDLDKLDFGGPISDSLKKATNGVQGQMVKLLQLPQINFGMPNVPMPSMSMSSTSRNNTDNSPSRPSVLTFILGGQEFEAHVDDITKSQDKKKYRLKKKRG